MKNEANGLTIRATFGNIPVIDNDLFEVRAGIDTDFATSEAACLADAIKHITGDAVENGGMIPQVAYLVAFTADVIRALSNSVDGSHKRKAVQS